MTYDIFSVHARSGESAIKVISPNPYSSQGRTIGFPSSLDVYVRHISDSDGSQSVQESRRVSDLIGSRLYLYHRPLINADGTVASITVSDGTIDTSFTNASQGYIVFSSLPSSDFTVSYVASPDCNVSWAINTLQDSVMEIQATLGPNTDTGFPGIRNLKIATFDDPSDAVASGVLQNAVQLSHLNQDITIASSDDPSLQIIRGDSHTIQIGRETDRVLFDVTGFKIQQSDGTLTSRVEFGTKTGDILLWKGQASGAGPLTIGGNEWPQYSGIIFSPQLTGSFYSGSMLKVHGDASFMGNVKAVGSITIVTATGTTSTVMGDWTVRDELFVDGVSHLNGRVEANEVEVNQHLYIDRDIIANDVNGNGGYGQSLVDNLDCSEVAWSYSTVIKSKHLNSVVSAPISTNRVSPKKTFYRPWMYLDGDDLAGEVFSITGQLNAALSSSGGHQSILQLLLTNTPMVSGTYNISGFTSGVWSPGMMDPGAMWVRMLNGPAEGVTTPIYGYTVEGLSGHYITRLNAFLSDTIVPAPQTNNYYMMYNPHSIQYNTISAVGGTTPTFSINASVDEPLAVSFEDSVRILTSNTTNYSMADALRYSISGLVGSTLTGMAYIFAVANDTDPENPPIFKAKPVPIRAPGQTPIGEVVASFTDPTWTILETVSYRPNGRYDSSWIPIQSQVSISATSGRCLPAFGPSSTSSLKVYFQHCLGSDVDIGNISADMYIGAMHSGTNNFHRTSTPMYSFFGQDQRVGHGLSGSFFHVPLNSTRSSSSIANRDASIFYLDSALIGVDISPALIAGFPVSGSTLGRTPAYLRLVVNKNN